MKMVGMMQEGVCNDEAATLKKRTDLGQRLSVTKNFKLHLKLRKIQEKNPKHLIRNSAVFQGVALAHTSNLKT